MPWRASRRGLLRTGAGIGAAGLAGCSGSLDRVLQGTESDVVDVIVRTAGDTVRAVEGGSGDLILDGQAGRDDAEVIQRAFEALGSTGGTVVIKRGTYEIREYPSGMEKFGIVADGTTVVSDYAHLRFHDHAGSKPQVDFTVHGHDHVRLDGLVIDGNRDERSGPTRTLDIANARHVTVEDCVIRGGRSRELDGGAGYGINPFECDHLTVHNCLIRDNDRHGIHPGSNDDPMRGFQFTNNTFVANATNPTGAAIDFRDGSTRAIVAHNYFERNGTAIRIKGGDPPDGFITVSDNVLWRNRLGRDLSERYPGAASDFSSRQIDLAGPTFDTIAITDNLFGLAVDGAGDRPSRHIAVADADGETLRIVGNYFRGGNDPAVTLSGDDEAIGLAALSANHFDRTPEGVALVGGARDAVITDNVFATRDSRGPILVEGSHDRAAVTGNVIVGGRFSEALESHPGTVLEGNVSI